MTKLVTGLFIVMLLLSAMVVYSFKEANEGLEVRKVSLIKSIKGDQEAIKILKAEIIFLSRPERLQKISERYFHLKAMNGAQLIEAVDIIALKSDIREHKKWGFLSQRTGKTSILPLDDFSPLLPKAKPRPKKVRRNWFRILDTEYIFPGDDEGGKERNTIHQITIEQEVLSMDRLNPIQFEDALRYKGDINAQG